MNWLVTGGCGFIGANLIRYIKRNPGDSIRVVDNLSVGGCEHLAAAFPVARYESQPNTALPALHPDEIQLVVGNIQDTALAERACRDIDVVVHLAANTGVGPSVADPQGDCHNNVIGTLNFLEGARHCGVRRFVFASSGAPVGAVDPPIHENVVPRPVSPYGASKLAGEGYCSAYAQTFNVETVALRFGNVYGPGSTHKSSVVAQFAKNALEGEPLTIYGDGTQTRDFIFIDDLLKAIELAASQPQIGGEIFQIAMNTEVTVAELAERMGAILAEDGYRDIAIQHAEPRLGDVKRNYSDTRKAREQLGWQPAHSLDDGQCMTLEYFIGEKTQQVASA